MRVRLVIYLLMGVASLVLASGEFLGALHPGWRAPVAAGQRGRSRQPTEAETQAFTELANLRLKYAGLWVLAGVAPFCAFGAECMRVYRARRASPSSPS